MKWLGAVLSKEPVLLGAAIVAGVAIFKPSEAVNAFVLAVVAWGVRMLSAPKAAVDEAHAAGHDKAVAEIASLATPPSV